MNGWRRALPRLLRDTEERYYETKNYPLCWNVKMYKPVSFEDVWQRMCTPDFDFINEAEAITRIPSKEALREAWDERFVASVLVDMCEDFTDGDTMQYCTPELEKKYGIKLPENGLKCKYEFVGRSGGWLALTGIRECDIRELPNAMLPFLFAMIEEISNAVDRRHEEFTYQLAFSMRHNMPEVVPE